MYWNWMTLKIGWFLEVKRSEASQSSGMICIITDKQIVSSPMILKFGRNVVHNDCCVQRTVGHSRKTHVCLTLYSMLHSFLVTANCHTVPYHTGPPWHRFATNIRPIKIAKCTCPAGMGRNSGECIHYPGVGGALLLPLFCWQCVCVVCAREKEGRFKDFCLLFYKLGLYVGFLWGRALLPDSSVVPTLARTRGPGALRPSSSGLSQI